MAGDFLLEKFTFHLAAEWNPRYNGMERSGSMAVLVCGGAGYIGSHAVYALIEKG